MLLAVFTVGSIPLSSTKIKTLQSQWLQGFFLYFQWFAGFIAVIFRRDFLHSYTLHSPIFTDKLLTGLLMKLLMPNNAIVV
jgi:hypothetical protein